MSAKELLKQVGDQLEQLPPGEREAFLDGILHLDESLPRTPRPYSSQPLRWPDIHLRHRQIFGDTVLTENIVLAAREDDDS